MSPLEVTALEVLAHVFLQNAQADKAVAILQALDTLRPADSRALLALATAHLRSGAPLRAIAVLDRIDSLAAPPPEAHLLRAQALRALDRHGDALESMRRFIALRPLSRPVESATE